MNFKWFKPIKEDLYFVIQMPGFVNKVDFRIIFERHLSFFSVLRSPQITDDIYLFWNKRKICKLATRTVPTGHGTCTYEDVISPWIFTSFNEELRDYLGYRFMLESHEIISFAFKGTETALQWYFGTAV